MYGERKIMKKIEGNAEDVKLAEQKEMLHQIIETLCIKFEFGEKTYEYLLHDELNEVKTLKEKLYNAKDFYEVDDVELKLFELEQKLPSILK